MCAVHNVYTLPPPSIQKRMGRNNADAPNRPSAPTSCPKLVQTKQESDMRQWANQPPTSTFLTYSINYSECWMHSYPGSTYKKVNIDPWSLILTPSKYNCRIDCLCKAPELTCQLSQLGLADTIFQLFAHKSIRHPVCMRLCSKLGSVYLTSKYLKFL